MNGRICRFLALMVAALLALSAVTAWAELLEEPVPEIEALLLDDEAGETSDEVIAQAKSDALAAADAVIEEAPEEIAAQSEYDDTDEASEALAAEFAAAADPDDMVFDSTRHVSGETWRNVNLTRTEGFTGKLAVIEGTLTLDNVRIEGTPANAVNPIDWFELSPGARVACVPGEGLCLSLSAVSINKDKRVTLSPALNGASIKAKKAKWSSSDKNIASVSSGGEVKGRKRGTAIITATYEGKAARCAVVVTDIAQPRKINLAQSSVKLALYEARQLSYTITPSNAVVNGVRWSSSKPSVVSVDESGNITGLSSGEAKITVVTANGKKATCKVKVNEIKPTSLTLSEYRVRMTIGDAHTVAAAIAPSNASNKTVRFTSGNTAVATVDKGVIRAVGQGTSIITATCAADATITATCRVTVVTGEAVDDSQRLAGLTIGINPGHQHTTIKKHYPLAPGSSKTAKGVKTGASGKATGQHEYEVVLDIGLKLKRILEEHGATVVITRTTSDVMLTNIDRAQMLNEAGCDVALQLHNNSCTNSSKTGVSGYIRTTGDWVEESRGLSECICEGMAANTPFKNLGVKIENGYMSLNWTTTPSVLLEMGYLSNHSDDRLLARDDIREGLAWGIYEGLCDYYGR